MIDQVNGPKEFPNLLQTLAGVFVDSIDEAKKEKVFQSFCPSQKDFEVKVTDTQLRAKLLIALKKSLTPTVESLAKETIARKRDENLAKKRKANHFWTGEEDEKLRDGFRLYGKQWRKIVEHVGDLTKKQVYQRAYALGLTQTNLQPDSLKDVLTSAIMNESSSLI